MSPLSILVHWLVSGLAITLTAAVVPGFRVRKYSTALVASVLIGAAGLFVRPVLVFFTLPLTIVTLGLFLFVVDAIILRICGAVLKGFEIDGWIAAILTAIVLAFASSVLHGVLI